MSIQSELSDLLGSAAYFEGNDVPASARSDESHVGRSKPDILICPSSVAEVSAALRICHKYGRSVVPQGGMTGLAGGANPMGGDVALSLARFAGVEDIDPLSGTMLVRAGTILQTAQEAAEAAGLLLPVDFGARGSCQIGGLLATNAGGLRVIRYGTVRANVLGLEMVLADGSVLSHLNRMAKDNTGLDLRNLMIGSEGVLGVITRAVFRLCPRPAEISTALCALPDAEAAVKLLGFARSRLILSAFEAMWPDYFELNCTLEGHRFFADAPQMVVLVEAEGSLDEFLEEAFETGLIVDALPAQSLSDARRFWDVREGHRIDNALPGLVNFDVSLDIGRAPGFVERVQMAVKAKFSQAKVLFFGHMGDGNLHAVIHVARPDEHMVEALDAIVYGEVRAVGGSISAEHGVGVLKRPWLSYSRSPEELVAMRAIKAALDPTGIMNPGKLL